MTDEVTRRFMVAEQALLDLSNALRDSLHVTPSYAEVRALHVRLTELRRELGRPPTNTLPNGLVQGGAEDRATWWTCTMCGFHGPLVGSTPGGVKACMGAICGGEIPNPGCTFGKGT